MAVVKRHHDGEGEADGNNESKRDEAVEQNEIRARRGRVVWIGRGLRLLALRITHI
jgi:hypothetical protein